MKVYSVFAVASLALVPTHLVFAQTLTSTLNAPVNSWVGTESRTLQAIPFVFVGNAADCGTGYPAGSEIVTSAWLTGIGLPDNGGSNTPSTLTPNPNRLDPHTGLLLSKNGPTADCSSAGARIVGAEGMVITATSLFGYNFRNGGHCGAGATRFNLVTSDNMFHFVGGCANGTQTTTTQDPNWTQIRFNVLTQTFPPVIPGTSIKSLSILFDEGTDTIGQGDPGIAVIDDIYVLGNVIRKGRKGDSEENDHN